MDRVETHDIDALRAEVDESGDDPQARGEAVARLADALCLAGRNQEALVSTEVAADLLRRAGDAVAAAARTRLAGDLLAAMGRDDEAFHRFAAARDELTSAAGPVQDVAACSRAGADALRRLGRTEDARQELVFAREG